MRGLQEISCGSGWCVAPVYALSVICNRVLASKGSGKQVPNTEEAPRELAPAGVRRQAGFSFSFSSAASSLSWLLASLNLRW